MRLGSRQAVESDKGQLFTSLGIFSGKLVTAGLADKLRVHREAFRRGQAAGLYADDASFSDAERQKLRRSLQDGYARFKTRVTDGRRMTPERVEEIAHGRMWTGRQALARGLVDELDDLEAAVAQARALAGLDDKHQTPVVTLGPGRRYVLPLPLGGGAIQALQSLLDERVFALLPWHIRLRDG